MLDTIPLLLAVSHGTDNAMRKVLWLGFPGLTKKWQLPNNSQEGLLEALLLASLSGAAPFICDSFAEKQFSPATKLAP